MSRAENGIDDAPCGPPPDGMVACTCGRPFCAGVDVARAVTLVEGDPPLPADVVDIARHLSSTYEWSTTSHAQHPGPTVPLAVGPGWVGAAMAAMRRARDIGEAELDRLIAAAGSGDAGAVEELRAWSAWCNNEGLRVARALRALRGRK